MSITVPAILFTTEIFVLPVPVISNEGYIRMYLYLINANMYLMVECSVERGLKFGHSDCQVELWIWLSSIIGSNMQRNIRKIRIKVRKLWFGGNRQMYWCRCNYIRKRLTFTFGELQGKNKEKVISSEIKRDWTQVLYIQQQNEKKWEFNLLQN